MTRWALAGGLLMMAAGTSPAAVKTEAVEYKHGETVLEGFLAYDDAVLGPRPGVLVVHEWLGLNDYAKRRAEQLARLGYVAFALDMYGKGVRGKDRSEGPKLSAPYKKDRKLMRDRAAAGLAALQKHKLVDPKRVAVMGYCFGGTTSLELARSGADVAGVVVFHGNLETPNPDDAKNIKGKVLVLSGADDPIVPPAEVAAFVQEMRKAGVDWQLVEYGRAVHGYTNPASGNDPSKGVAYNAEADRRSWRAMRDFFEEIFGTDKK